MGQKNENVVNFTEKKSVLPFFSTSTITLTNRWSSEVVVSFSTSAISCLDFWRTFIAALIVTRQSNMAAVCKTGVPTRLKSSHTFWETCGQFFSSKGAILSYSIVVGKFVGRCTGRSQKKNKKKQKLNWTPYSARIWFLAANISSWKPNILK